MKAKLWKVLRFLKLDVLLLRVLDRLSDGLNKKQSRIQAALRRFLSRLCPATEE